MRELSTHAHVAKLIRAELKQLGIKASVRSRCFAYGNSVDINVCDFSIEARQELHRLLARYQYDYDNTNVRDGVPQVKFVQIRNHTSIKS